jgi:iron complex outermembrane receptor protein
MLQLISRAPGILLAWLIVSHAMHGQSVVDSVMVDTLPAFSVSAAPAFVYADRARTPFAISSISDREIENLDHPVVEPLLNAVPGIWMQSGALNTNRITIRGVGYREPFATTGIKIYLDEIPLTNGAGESSIEDIHPLILSGIDVWRSPASAIWGAGLGGMIHLKSKIPEDNKWISQLQAGSFDRIQLDQHLSFLSGKADEQATTLHYQYLYDGGYRENNSYRKHSMTWIQRWISDKGFTLQSFIHGINLKAYIPSSLNMTDFENAPQIAAPAWGAIQANEDYFKWIIGVNARYLFSPVWMYQGSVYSSLFDSDEVRPFNVLAESNSSYGMRHRLSHMLNDDLLINLGLEYFNELYQFSTFETLEGGKAGGKLSDGAEKRTYINLFLQGEYLLSSTLTLFGGVHLASNKLSGEGLKTKLPVFLYPTSGITWSFLPCMSASISVSRGYSNLSLDDLINSSGMINEELNPETGWSKDVSLKLGDPLNYVSIGYFHMNIENSILTLRIQDDIFEKINGGSSLHQGVEIEYRLQAFNQKLSLAGAYTYASFYNTDQDQHYFLPGSPAHRTYHRLFYQPLSFLQFNLTHQWTSEVYLNDLNSAKSDDSHVFHLGATVMLPISDRWSLSVRGDVHNVLNADYASMYQINAPAPPGGLPRYFYPGRPRAIYFSMKAAYHF